MVNRRTRMHMGSTGIRAAREDSSRRSTQLRGCPPTCGLLLNAAALSATPT
jgi:hypothetical protein